MKGLPDGRRLEDLSFELTRNSTSHGAKRYLPMFPGKLHKERADYHLVNVCRGDADGLGPSTRLRGPRGLIVLGPAKGFPRDGAESGSQT